ncbi:hypothetical protein A3860_18140 [Niastella vici]|uniref:Uncharacterized protein n=1 Tax=Niastella vici TaxID=1703345 RepID=A0A1V9G280_9BACT|nr:hypothetical protein A3860_18140 [Niastella vici]
MSVRLVGADGGRSVSLPGFSCLLNLNFFQRIKNTKHEKKDACALVFRGGEIKVVMGGRTNKGKGLQDVDETAVLTYLLNTISVPDNGLCTVCAPGIFKISTNVCVFILFAGWLFLIERFSKSLQFNSVHRKPNV